MTRRINAAGLSHIQQWEGIRMEGKVEQLERKIDDLDAKVTEMHQLLTQAKGARWMLMLMIGVGGFVAAKVTPLVQFALGR